MKNEGMQRNVFGRLNSYRRHSFTLRMAPMIDMVFLLLIFFLVAAKWRPEEYFLPFQLPAAQTNGQRLGRPEPLIIHIFATETGCQVQVGQLEAVRIENQTIEANLVTLMEKIKKCLQDQKRFATDPVEIICAPEVKWDYFAKICNLLRGAGLTDFTFSMTEQSHNGHFD